MTEDEAAARAAQERNVAAVDALMREGRLPGWSSRLLEEPLPGPPPKVERFAQAMIGHAIGNAFGRGAFARQPSDKRSPRTYFTQYPYGETSSRRIGVPSTPSQLTFHAIDVVASVGYYDPELIAARFCEIGPTLIDTGRVVRSALRQLRDGVSAQRSGGNGPTNGAMMWAPALLPLGFSTRSPAMLKQTALAALTTHSHPAAIAAAMTLNWLLDAALRLSKPPEPEWYFDVIVDGLSEFETVAPGHDLVQDGRRETGSLHRLVEAVVIKAYRAKRPLDAALSEWGSGGRIVECMPTVTYILMMRGHDPAAAIRAASNMTRDPGTTSAIVGAVVCAVHGIDSLPRAWIDELSGALGTNDERFMWNVLERVQRRFASPPRGPDDAETAGDGLPSPGWRDRVRTLFAGGADGWRQTRR